MQSIFYGMYSGVGKTLKSLFAPILTNSLEETKTSKSRAYPVIELLDGLQSANGKMDFSETESMLDRMDIKDRRVLFASLIHLQCECFAKYTDDSFLAVVLAHVSVGCKKVIATVEEAEEKRKNDTLN